IRERPRNERAARGARPQRLDERACLALSAGLAGGRLAREVRDGGVRLQQTLERSRCHLCALELARELPRRERRASEGLGMGRLVALPQRERARTERGEQQQRKRAAPARSRARGRRSRGGRLELAQAVYAHAFGAAQLGVCGQLELLVTIHAE